MTTLTLRDYRADGVTAAKEWIREGILQPQHFTNPGSGQSDCEGVISTTANAPCDEFMGADFRTSFPIRPRSKGSGEGSPQRY